MTIMKKTHYIKSYSVGGKIKWYSKFGKHFQFLKRLNIHFPHDQEIPLLIIYLWEMKTYVHTKTCKQIITATLSAITLNWKQPKCPSNSEWVNILWFVHTLAYCSAMERNKLLTHATTWMKLETSCKWMTPDTKGYVLHNSIYMKFLEKAKLWRQEAD